MVRMARLGLAMPPTLSLKVLTNFRLSLVTSYERILQISTKSKPTEDEDDDDDEGSEVVQEQPGGC